MGETIMIAILVMMNFYLARFWSRLQVFDQILNHNYSPIYVIGLFVSCACPLIISKQFFSSMTERDLDGYIVFVVLHVIWGIAMIIESSLFEFESYAYWWPFGMMGLAAIIGFVVPIVTKNQEVQ